MRLDPRRHVQQSAQVDDSDPLAQRAYMALQQAETDPAAAIPSLVHLVIDLLARVQQAQDTADQARLCGEALCASMHDLAGQLHTTVSPLS